MMKKSLRNWLALIGLAFLFACTDAKQNTTELELHGRTMGTTYSIKLLDNDTVIDGAALQQDIDALLDVVNQQMSTYRADSELSRFNQSQHTEPFNVSADTVRVVNEALRLGDMSQGALDVTVGPLVNLWGFGPQARPDKVPSDEVIQQTRLKTGLMHLTTQANQLQKNLPELYVDLSAIAKGFGVDKVAEHLEGLGVDHYMVEIGGELRLKGQNALGQDWRIAIEKPMSDGRAGQLVIQPGNLGMATSGDYRNYFETDGVRYSHTIDPATGKPIAHNLVSVTVLHPSSMTADGLATAINVMGPEKGLALAEAHDLSVFLIVKTEDGFEQHMSSKFATMRARRDNTE